MSKTPKLRFKEFSGDWESKCLEELFSFKNGLNKEKEFFGKGTPIVNFTDVYKNRGLKAEDIKGLVEVNEKELSNYNVSKGDVFFTRTSETIDDIGMSSVILDEVENTVFSGFVLRARPKNNILSDGFKKYCFSTFSARKEIVTKSSFTTRALTSGTLLNGVEINYPSKEEQEKISSFFSLIDDKISLQGEKLKMLKDYKTGMMQKIFSRELRFKDDEGRDYPEWEEKKLSEVSDVRDGTHDSPKYVESGYRFITSKHLSSNGKIDFSDISYISEEDYININKRSKVDIGDILFGMIGTIGNPVLVEESEFAIKNVALIKEKDDLLNKYLIQVLNSSIISRQFYTLNSGGTQKFIALGVIRDLVIPVPNKEEQIKIANFLCNLDKRIDKEQEKLDSLNEYKKGLLQQMFV